MNDAGQPEPLAAGKAFLILLVVVAAIAAYIGVNMALGIEAFYTGFGLWLYFGAFKQGDPRELPAATIGALGGILTAALLRILPEQLGLPGIIAIALLILTAIYLNIAGRLSMIFNNAYMLMLLIATIPALQAEGQFLGMAASILVAAAFAGAALLLAGLMASRKAATEEH